MAGVYYRLPGQDENADDEYLFLQPRQAWLLWALVLLGDISSKKYRWQLQDNFLIQVIPKSKKPVKEGRKPPWLFNYVSDELKSKK